MLVNGLGLASWITRTPAVRDALHASTAEMGIVLFGLSVGSMLGVLSSGALVRHFSTRPIIAVGPSIMGVGVGVIGISAAATSSPGVFTGLMLFGLGMGMGEIAINVEGAAIETAMGKPLMPVLHGTFSLGTVIGAAVGIALSAIDFPVFWHLIAAVVVIGMTMVWATPGIAAGTGVRARTPRHAAAPRVRRPSVWRDRRVIMIALVMLAIAFAEGSANDWLPLLMVDGHGVSPALGSMVFAGFAVMMTIGRFAGGPIVERFGRAAVLQTSALLAIAGILTVILAPNAIVAGIAAALWGLGASLGFPVAISAAGDDPDRAAERVSAVATSGYIAFLVGPPLLGFLGEEFGLRSAMYAVVALLVVAVFAAGATRRAPAATEDAPDDDRREGDDDVLVARASVSTRR